jgi:hypothetical protein
VISIEIAEPANGDPRCFRRNLHFEGRLSKAPNPQRLAYTMPIVSSSITIWNYEKDWISHSISGEVFTRKSRLFPPNWVIGIEKIGKIPRK